MGTRTALTVIAAVTLVGWPLSSIALAQAAPPREILDRAFQNEERQKTERARYFYREHSEHFQAAKAGERGKLNFTQDYEWIYLEGEPFRKLVRIDGKLLHGRAAKEEELRMESTAAERRAKPWADRNRKVIAFGNVALADIQRMMGASLLREEEVDGQKAWVIRAEAPPGTVGTTDVERKALCYRFTFWIDEEDFVISRDDYELTAERRDTLPGSRSSRTRWRSPEAVWFGRTTKGEFSRPRVTGFKFTLFRISRSSTPVRRSSSKDMTSNRWAEET